MNYTPQEKVDYINTKLAGSEVAKKKEVRASLVGKRRIEYTRSYPGRPGSAQKITFTEAISVLDGRDMRDCIIRFSTSRTMVAAAKRVNAQQ